MSAPSELLFDVAGDPDGEVVFLLHGFPLSRAIWTNVLMRLPQRFRLVAPDFPGHGATPASADTPTMDSYAQDVLALADRLGAQRFHVVGHSMGGYVAFALARLAADRVATLTLVTTRATGDSDAAKVARRKQADMVQMDGLRGLADLLVPKLLAPGPKSIVHDEVRLILEGTPVTGAVHALEAMAERPDATPDLGAITAPTLVVVGEKDQVMPAAEQDAITRGIPNARQEIIAGVGHLPMLEDPDRFAAVVGGFLDKPA